MTKIDLNIQHFFSNNLYAKQMHLPAGHYAVSHKHTYDHLSILATGVANVTTDQETRTHTAPACIDIKAGVEHTIVAITDVDWFCLHATQETDVNKVDEVLIQGEV